MKKTVAVFCALLLSGCSYKGNPPSGEDIKSAFKTYTNFKTDNLHVEVEECERTNPMEQLERVRPNRDYEPWAIYTCVFVMSYKNPPVSGQVFKRQIGEFNKTYSWHINDIKDY